MNGDTGRPYSTQGHLAPAYSLLRDVENGKTGSNQSAVGRYTAISKTVTRGNGVGGQSKGSYQPASHCSMSESSRRSAFKQTGSPISYPIGVSSTSSTGGQYAKQNAWSTAQVNGHCSHNVYNGYQNSGLANGGHIPEAVSKDPLRAYESSRSRTQAVTTSSTLILRDCSREPSGVVGLQGNNRSLGGSLSCGQPSPSSTGGEASVNCVSPTGSARGGQQGYLNGQQQSHYRPHHLFGQPDPLWFHQSELHLPTGRDAAGKYWDEPGGSDYCSSTIPRRLNTEFEKSQADIAVGTDLQYHRQQAPQPKHYGSCNFNSELPTPNSQCYSSSSMMLYGNRNPSDDHLNNIHMGPSSRKIQTLHGMGNNQRRFPSDTNLHFTPKERQQVYTSGSRPGPVTIPARSRSAQPSPGPSPCVSPTSLYRASETNLSPDYSASNGRSRGFRLQQFQEMNYNATPVRRGNSSPPSSGRHTNTVENGSESPILPSVKEIIRQVEAMTQANAATSTTDISVLGQSVTGTGVTGIPRFQRQLNGRKSLPSGDSGYSRSGGFYRHGGNQRTPSAPQLRQYTPIQAKFNASVSTSRQDTSAPPVPPHGTSQSKAVLGSFTRRMEPHSVDGSHRQRSEVCINPPNQKKIEMLSQLPMDYQKLREAFIEQRREIQRLRKQLAEKDLLISQLQTDIRLYEPWR